MEVHKEEEESPDFTMKVYRVVQNTLNRQILEGKKIGAFKGKYPLNGRGEWGENCVPKLTLEEDKPGEKRRHWPPSTATQGRNKRARRCKEGGESTGVGDEPHSEPESKREDIRSAGEGPGDTPLRSQNERLVEPHSARETFGRVLEPTDPEETPHRSQNSIPEEDNCSRGEETKPGLSFNVGIEGDAKRVRKPLNIKQILAKMNLSGTMRRPVSDQEDREKLDLHSRGADSRTEPNLSSEKIKITRKVSRSEGGQLGSEGRKSRAKNLFLGYKG